MRNVVLAENERREPGEGVSGLPGHPTTLTGPGQCRGGGLAGKAQRGRQPPA